MAIAAYGHAEDVRFEKDNGTIELSRADDGVTFSINSAIGQYSCEASGMAKTVTSTQFSYTSPDGYEGKDKCRVIIDFISTEQVKVTTDSCSYYCGMQAIGSMDGDYKKAIKNVQGNEVDFNSAALMMYSSYIGYQNGIAAMYDKEESCWKEIGSDINHAKYCATASLAGGFVEAGYARQEGRVSAPNYQPDAIKNRIVERMKQHGFSEDEINSARDYVGLNTVKIIVGLANAGMH